MFQKFKDSYDKAIKDIERYLTPDNGCDMQLLVRWMLETDANPYSYLPKNWADAVNYAEGFASLLGYIHHAAFDDGDITFVTVNGEPKIVFASQYDDDFMNHVLGETERYMMEHHKSSYDVSVLNIQPNDFGAVYDAWYVDNIKQMFLTDADYHGKEFAIRHYSGYKKYDPAWVSLLDKE